MLITENTNNNLLELNNTVNIINDNLNNLNKKLNILINFQKKILKLVDIENEDEEDNISDCDNIINHHYLKKNIIRNIKSEIFDIDKDNTLKYLTNNDITSDVNLFKILYLDNVPKHMYPLQFCGKKIYKYWCNNCWNTDQTGAYIKNTILGKNIANIYLNLNQIEYIKNMDQFINNQTHILKLSDPKYQEKWLTSIKEFITI